MNPNPPLFLFTKKTGGSEAAPPSGYGRQPVRAAILALSLTACAAAPPPQDAFYRLTDIHVTRPFDHPTLPGVLEVNRLDSDGVLAERALAYQDAEGALSRYRYHLWSEAPGTLLRDQLAETLRQARAADHVVTPDLRVPPDWSLRGKIMQFEQVPTAGKVVAKVQLAVVSARDGTLVLLQTYSAEAVAGSDPQAAVDALNRAAATIVSRFLADLAQSPVPQLRR